MTSKAQEIRRAIDRGAALPHQAAALAMQLFLLRLDPEENRSESQRLVDEFFRCVPLWGMEDLLSVQVEYARRLAASPGTLEYEEMHKLFSLCDEIQALKELGMRVTAAEMDNLEAALQARFRAEPKKARLAADDKVEDWTRESWWYAENLQET